MFNDDQLYCRVKKDICFYFRRLRHGERCLYSKSYGLGRDASKISIDMIDRYHSQQNLSDLEESGSVHGVHPSKNRVYTNDY